MKCFERQFSKFHFSKSIVWDYYGNLNTEYGQIGTADNNNKYNCDKVKWAGPGEPS